MTEKNVTLHPRTEEHVRIYFEKASDPEIRKWLPQKAKTVEEAVEDFARTCQPGATSYGRTVYADGCYVGDIWCYCIGEEEMPDAMVSYCIFEKSHWGKGIATKALAQFLTQIREGFSLKHIGAFTYAENIPSCRVLERNGFTLRETFTENGILSAYYQKDLPMTIYQSITQKTPIDKGWSGDKKYCVTTHDGSRYLLRITAPERKERFYRCFARMQEAAAQRIPMCLPLEFGQCSEGVYAIHSWVEGVDTEEYIPTLSCEAQYAYGLDAGRILKKIHSIPAPKDAPDWELRFNAKIDRKIAMYESCPLKYEKGEKFLSFLAQNRHLLAGRPQTFQHGDYHIGNMLVDKGGTLTIIDFDRDDFGDPWEEFNRIVWCAQASPSFASGMVDGYFDGDVPMDFWKLLALYIASNTLSSLPWAVDFGEGEVAVMRKQAAQVLLWYEDMENPVPTWYQKP